MHNLSIKLDMEKPDSQTTMNSTSSNNNNSEPTYITQSTTLENPQGEITLAACPCRHHLTETQHHLLRYDKNPDDHSALTSLGKALLTDDIHPIRYLLFEGIRHWTMSPELQFSPSVFCLSHHICTTPSRTLSDFRHAPLDANMPSAVSEYILENASQFKKCTPQKTTKG